QAIKVDIFRVALGPLSITSVGPGFDKLHHVAARIIASRIHIIAIVGRNAVIPTVDNQATQDSRSLVCRNRLIDHAIEKKPLRLIKIWNSKRYKARRPGKSLARLE